MEDSIKNRVAESALMTFNLEDYYPEGIRSSIDIAPWLYQGILLKETEFRQALKEFDGSVYQDHYVALHCSSDAILPAWAFLLVSTYLQPYARKILIGTLEELDTLLMNEALDKIDLEAYRDGLVIIKGCSKKPVPENAYLLIAQKLQPIVKKLMYGEACSSVPLYKKP